MKLKHILFFSTDLLFPYLNYIHHIANLYSIYNISSFSQPLFWYLEKMYMHLANVEIGFVMIMLSPSRKCNAMQNELIIEKCTCETKNWKVTIYIHQEADDCPKSFCIQNYSYWLFSFIQFNSNFTLLEHRIKCA